MSPSPNVNPAWSKHWSPIQETRQDDAGEHACSATISKDKVQSRLAVSDRQCGHSVPARIYSFEGNQCHLDGIFPILGASLVANRWAMATLLIVSIWDYLRERAGRRNKKSSKKYRGRERKGGEKGTGKNRTENDEEAA